ncbi:hypothetical protein Bca4012_012940 [Brassica carinata]|uniref:SCP domain-containing protein n=1 Tax=Brassica carinata TaxID=52824 RepID=A0A8X7Q605_BRACI|nr:hypothetical protein Bca52824_069477 [Brassica carinata]
MSSSLFLRQFFLFISSLFLLFSGDVPSAAGAPSSGAVSTRAMMRGRRNKLQTMEFLNAHNAARVASGASHLRWDQGLARFAYDWAKQRKSDCKMTHSGGPHGENIFWYQRSVNWTPKRVVATWVDESLHYDRTTNSCGAGKMCGHYTQIIWRTTTAVGCARIRCDNNLGFLVVCEYSPGGNYEGESPFDSPK